MALSCYVRNTKAYGKSRIYKEQNPLNDWEQ
jgi:hypothetical protein